jgi:hypothetical protein
VADKKHDDMRERFAGLDIDPYIAPPKPAPAPATPAAPKREQFADATAYQRAEEQARLRALMGGAQWTPEQIARAQLAQQVAAKLDDPWRIEPYQQGLGNQAMNPPGGSGSANMFGSGPGKVFEWNTSPTLPPVDAPPEAVAALLAWIVSKNKKAKR